MGLSSFGQSIAGTRSSNVGSSTELVTDGD
jgi:hypothetical protein